MAPRHRFSYEHSAYYCAKRLSYYSQRAYPLVLSFGYTTYTVLLFKRPNSPVQPEGVPSYLSGTHHRTNLSVRGHHSRTLVPTACDLYTPCSREVRAFVSVGPIIPTGVPVLRGSGSDPRSPALPPGPPLPIDVSAAARWQGGFELFLSPFWGILDPSCITGTFHWTFYL